MNEHRDQRNEQAISEIREVLTESPPPRLDKIRAIVYNLVKDKENAAFNAGLDEGQEN